MSSLRETFVILTCLLVIVGIEAASHDNSDDEGILFYSSGSAIHTVSLGQKKKDLFTDNPLLRYVGIAASTNPDNVYWSTINVDKKTIMRSVNTELRTEVIADTGLVAPERLAVDWVTGNVYFIDNYKKHIGVCTADGSKCTVILNSTVIDTPGGLVLNPQKGEMFWSDYGRNPAIWRAGMDGGGAEAIVTESLGWPKDVAIDYKRKRLYWIDSKFTTIESVYFNGTDRDRLVKLKNKQPHSITIFGEEIYWSDWKTKTIRSLNIATGIDREIIVTESELIYDIDIYHSSLKPPLSNPCDNHHHCSEICLLAEGRKYSCACKLGNVLNVGSNTCSPINKPQHLMIAVGDQILHYHEEILGRALIKETLTPLWMSRIIYDRTTGNLITDDQYTNSLFSLNPENNEIRRITRIQNKNLGGIDIDYKNNITYWSVANPRRIDQINLNDGTAIWPNSFEDVPQDLLSIPGYDKSFVVFKSDAGRLHLDWLYPGEPSETATVVPKLIGPKISLAYDERSESLYFADEGTGNIESVSTNVNASYVQRELLCSGADKPVSLAVLNRKVFWTVRNSNVLQWVDIEDEYHEIKSTILPVENSVGIMDIVAVDNVTI